MNRIGLVAVLLVVAVLAGYAGMKLGQRALLPPVQEPPRGLEVARQGERAPDIRLPDIDGQLRALSEWHGRPLMINFWASWCAPCVEEMPLLDRFSREQGEQGVQVLGVALDSQEAVADFLEQVPVGYPIVFDQPGPADSSVQLGNSRGVLPYSVLLDAEGRVMREKLGIFSERELREWAADASRQP